MLPKNPNEDLVFDMNCICEIHLAGGCFWGTDAYMRRVPGVYYSETGYANGNKLDPTYEDVCTQTTEFAETVLVKYDSSIVSLEQIIENYLKTINMFSINKQGEDTGNQYRTGIYYQNENDKLIAEKLMFEIQKQYTKKITIEILPLKNYFKAEEYHQDYLEKNPNGYCHVDLSSL